jgi:hypothetical protein
MNEPILRIPQKKYSGESTIVSMRITKDLLRDIVQVATLSGRSRNEIMALSLEFALTHTEIMFQEKEAF